MSYTTATEPMTKREIASRFAPQSAAIDDARDEFFAKAGSLLTDAVKLVTDFNKLLAAKADAQGTVDGLSADTVQSIRSGMKETLIETFWDAAKVDEHFCPYELMAGLFDEGAHPLHVYKSEARRAA